MIRNEQMEGVRVQANRALAKALAYKQCGNDRDAGKWAAELVEILREAGIRVPDTPRIDPRA